MANQAWKAGTNGRLFTLLSEHFVVLLIYGLLGIILSWPLLSHFTTHIAGGGGTDAQHNLWVLWHVKEAVLGNQPLWGLPLLYYPEGASLLTHGLGPVTGILALPFWPLGPEAAHNGAVLLSLVITSYSVYCLARTLGLQRPVAVFAGIFILAAPMHLAGILGHMTKVFMAGPALVLLGLVNSLRLDRSFLWAFFTGGALLLTLAHNGYQFIFTSLVVSFFSIWMLWQTSRPLRSAVGRRLLLTGATCVLFAGPLLVAILISTANPELQVGMPPQASINYKPDAVEFVMPSARVGAFLGRTTASLLRSVGVTPSIETTVFLSWTGIILALLILFKGTLSERGWLIGSVILIVLGLGPLLQIAGKNSFTVYQLPVILPYAFLTSIPGMDVMRVPGRSMMVGYTLWSVTVAFGLTYLISRWQDAFASRRWSNAGNWLLPLLASVLILIEFWPIRWPMKELRQVPALYKELAQDKKTYGILDLPFKATPEDSAVRYSAHYQMYQMIHKKGIAMGYISRTYRDHPTFPNFIPTLSNPLPDVFVDGRPIGYRKSVLYELAAADYRYVVWHQAKPQYRLYRPGAWGEQHAAQFIDMVFCNDPPLVKNELIQAYRIPSVSDVIGQFGPILRYGTGWYRWEGGHRWASSPATIVIELAEPRNVDLELIPGPVFDADSERGLGREGTLEFAMPSGEVLRVDIRAGERKRVPLALPAGRHEIKVSLEAGNFRPSEYDLGRDRRVLSFALRSINLLVEDDYE